MLKKRKKKSFSRVKFGRRKKDGGKGGTRLDLAKRSRRKGNREVGGRICVFSIGKRKEVKRRT